MSQVGDDVREVMTWCDVTSVPKGTRSLCNYSSDFKYVNVFSSVALFKSMSSFHCSVRHASSILIDIKARMAAYARLSALTNWWLIRNDIKCGTKKANEITYPRAPFQCDCVIILFGIAIPRDAAVVGPGPEGSEASASGRSASTFARPNLIGAQYYTGSQLKQRTRKMRLANLAK